MRRLRRSTKQYLVIVLLSLLIIGAAFAAAYFLILRNIEKSYGIRLESLSKELDANQRYVYEAVSDLEAGTCLTEELLEYKMVYTGQAADTFITQADLGKAVLISIPKGVYLQKNMLQELPIADNVREAEFSCIQLADHILANDTVDVRLCYPNGENYIVLSKKVIRACSEDHSQCYLWLTEEEILLMSSAIVDAYLYSGAYLYSTKYIEPTLQEASIVNYQASLVSQKLIRENPNIVEVAAKSLSQQVRKALENRLAENLSLEVGEIQWEVPDTTEQSESKTTPEKGQEEERKDSSKTGEDFLYYSEEVKAKKEDVEYGQ